MLDSCIVLFSFLCYSVYGGSMKIGRNDKCPCGSGLKYKNCCLNKKNEEVDLMSGLMNLHHYVLSNKDHIKKYRKIRKAQGFILDSMVHYISNEKYEVSASVVEKASSILLHKVNLDVLKKVLYDGDNLYYTLFYFGKNSLSHLFLEKNRYKDAFKIKILKAMENAYTGIFDIVETDIYNGYVTLKDVGNGTEFKVIDQSMSVNEHICGKMYLYSRIATVDGISFNNVAIPLNINNKDVIKLVEEYHKNKIVSSILSLCVFDIFNSKDNKVSFNIY